jgi:hypothetical protein
VCEAILPISRLRISHNDCAFRTADLTVQILQIAAGPQRSPGPSPLPRSRPDLPLTLDEAQANVERIQLGMRIAPLEGLKDGVVDPQPEDPTFAWDLCERAATESGQARLGARPPVPQLPWRTRSILAGRDRWLLRWPVRTTLDLANGDLSK